MFLQYISSLAKLRLVFLFDGLVTWLPPLPLMHMYMYLSLYLYVHHIALASHPASQSESEPQPAEAGEPVYVYPLFCLMKAAT